MVINEANEDADGWMIPVPSISSFTFSLSQPFFSCDTL